MAARLTLDVLPPILSQTLRFATVAILIVPFMPRPDMSWRALFFTSTLLITLHFPVVFGAMWLGLDTSSTIIATQLGAPFSCILGSIFLEDRLGRWRSLGMLISFAGVVVIAGTPHIAEQFIPFLLACGGALAWAGANIVIKQAGKVDILPLIGWVSLLGAPQLLLFSLLLESGQMEALTAPGTQHWLALGYTIIFSTLIAYGTWYYLLKHFPISQVTPFSLMIPLFGMVAVHLMLDEHMTTQFLIGSVLTIAGVAIIVLRRPRIGIMDRS